MSSLALLSRLNALPCAGFHNGLLKLYELEGVAFLTRRLPYGSRSLRISLLATPGTKAYAPCTIAGRPRDGICNHLRDQVSCPCLQLTRSGSSITRSRARLCYLQRSVHRSCTRATEAHLFQGNRKAHKSRQAIDIISCPSRTLSHLFYIRCLV